jgi:predicted site-specific integrase-resolvase
MTETHWQNRVLGYARVSTYGQTLDAQLEQLRDAGCTNRNIYREKVTGARADRRELLKLLKALAPGRVAIETILGCPARAGIEGAYRPRQITANLSPCGAIRCPSP